MRLARNQTGKRKAVVIVRERDCRLKVLEASRITPELILKEAIDPGLGLTPFQARKLAFGMGVPAGSVSAATAAMIALAKAYEGIDATLAEINPFILTADGKVYALDAKVTLDDKEITVLAGEAIALAGFIVAARNPGFRGSRIPHGS